MSITGTSIAAIANVASPDRPTSPAELRWSDEMYPGAVLLIAELGGRPVGAATVEARVR